MDRDQLLEELARLQAQVDEAPQARESAPAKAPEVELGLDDIAPTWTVPMEMCGRDLLRDGISAYCPDGRKMREFIPGQTITGVTMAVKHNVLSILGQAADQYRQNMINRGRTVQNAPMEFDA